MNLFCSHVSLTCLVHVKLTLSHRLKVYYLFLNHVFPPPPVLSRFVSQVICSFDNTQRLIVYFYMHVVDGVDLSI